MNKKEIIKKTAEFIKKELSGETTGHDWYHTYRVWKLAKKISKQEGGDIFIIEMSALLHDLDDWKFSDNFERVKKYLSGLALKKSDELDILHVIQNISFKGAKVKNKIKTLEGKIVQDADRIDALGAIGIARLFAYGGFNKLEIYNPEIKPIFHKTFKEHKNFNTHSINHFYEKLLLLKDKMNTATGKKIAQKGHDFIKIYLKEFFKEWNCKF